MGGAGLSGSAEIGLWVLCAGMVISIALNATRLWMAWSGKSERREVTMTAPCATKEFVAAHVEKNDREHAQIFAKIGGIERGFREDLRRETSEMRNDTAIIRKEFADSQENQRLEFKRDLVDVHEKINDVAKTVSAIDERSKQQTEILTRISTRVCPNG